MALNRRVVLQVTMPALLVALAMLGTGLLGIRSINHLQADRDKIVSEHVRSLQDAQDLETELRHLRFHSYLYVMDMTPPRWAKVEKDLREFEQILGTIRDRAETPEEKKVVREIESGYTLYREELANSDKAPLGPSKEECLRWADAHPIRYIVTPCEELLELNRKAMRETAEESERQSDTARSRMILLGAMGAAGGLIGGFGVAWGMNRSITRLSVRLQDVHAQLDRDVGTLRLTAEGGDLHRVERQVGAILERVHDVVARLRRQETDALWAEHLAAVGQLAAGVAHEVRNPLTSIKLLVGAALNGRCGKGLTEADLRVIYDEVERMERKVQGLLDYARPLEIDRRPTDVNAVAVQVAELVKERLRKQAVHLKLDLPTPPVTADLDRDQFQGVLVNLVLNALDALPGGGDITLGVVRDADRTLRVTVADTGPGLSPATADRLFTPFFSTKPTGTGLGLSVSRRVVQAHGGTLTAANRDGGGATFTVTLMNSD